MNERQQREVDAMMSCSHQSIASLFDIGIFEGKSGSYFWVVEEYLGGGTLAEKIRAQKYIQKKELKGLALTLVDAVEHIASRKLVHRDIKPENIMFRERVPVIVDFGLVRDLNATSLTASWVLHGPGTPLYASPEQLNNDKVIIGWRADQFSLGVVLSYGLTGKHPYQRDDDLPGTIVQRVYERQKISPSFEKVIEEQKLQVLRRMVEPWPVQRFRIPSDLKTEWEKV